MKYKEKCNFSGLQVDVWLSITTAIRISVVECT